MFNNKKYKSIFIISISLITVFCGLQIYKSSTNYGSKLSRFIERLKNERTVEFEKNNIYEHGVQGIFEDINKKYPLPKKLYMSNDFNLKFNSNGTITSFETFIYGKSNKGKLKSYLITYDEDKSNKIVLRLRGHVNADYNDDKLVEPLVETVKAINLDEIVNELNENKYGLVYKGKRSWGYNIDGIININELGEEQPIDNMNEIIGYTVSIFIPGREDEIIPYRYNLICN